MKTLIIILIIAAFLQTTIIPIDLVLLILICRAYIKTEFNNLYLAFGFGLLVSHLKLNTLGFENLIYLIATTTTQVLSRLRLAGNPLLVVPVSFIFLSLNEVMSLYFNLKAFGILKVIIASLLSLPMFYLLRLWEERFIVRKEIKLRV